MKILVDSDFLIANFKSNDSNHKKASKLAKKFHNLGYKYYCSNLVQEESATVISKRIGMAEAKTFYNNLDNFIDRFIYFEEKFEKKAWRLFLQQNKKGTSFIDCSNVILAEEYNLKIASFDKFYDKKFMVLSD